MKISRATQNTTEYIFTNYMIRVQNKLKIVALFYSHDSECRFYTVTQEKEYAVGKPRHYKVYS